MTPDMTVEGAEEVARDAARRITAAVAALSPLLAMNLAVALLSDRSTTLNAIGDGLLSRNPVPKIARALSVETFIGDAEVIAPKLGSAEPWGSIGSSAITDAAAAWRAAHPTFRTRQDRLVIAQRWAQEMAREGV
jgi:hypothetical protein